jgi:RNA polymerase sigma-70 factor, ECF subfamily
MDKAGLEFQAVYNDFHPKILRYLTNMVGENDAEDLTQEVFAKVSRVLGTFRGECKFSTWLYRIATNVAIDKMRTPSFRQEADLIALDTSDDLQDLADGSGPEMPSVERSLMNEEMVQCFMDYVKKLPENYRTIVVLSELEEFTNNEIADILGLSLNVVKIRLHRGRTKLIQELKSHCKAEDWL